MSQTTAHEGEDQVPAPGHTHHEHGYIAASDPRRDGQAAGF